MRTELKEFEKEFNSLKFENNNYEYWFARDLMSYLGYKSWDKFLRIIIKAMDLCRRNENNINDLFVPIMSYQIIPNLLFDYEISDYKLDRMACFLIFMVSNDKYDRVKLGKEYIEYKKIVFE